MSSSSTEGKVIKCRGIVAYGVNQPLKVELVDVAPPKKGEVRIKIYATGVCHSDLIIYDGTYGQVFPLILGHEGAGVVESVGEGVTSVKPGDHVIPSYMSLCRECKGCQNPENNFCDKLLMHDSKSPGVLSDGTSRFSIDGKPVYNFLNTGTFIEYTVISEIACCKINPKAPLDKVCLLGCGIPTGYGAALKVAKVKKDSSCAIWGLGGIGLSAIMGAKAAGAKTIVAIDINPSKFEKAIEFGATECLNPLDFKDKPLAEVVREKYDGGFDYTFECIGNIRTMTDAIYCTHIGWGVCVIVGAAPEGSKIPVDPEFLLGGLTIKGCYFGGWRSRDDIPELVEKYLRNELKVDEFITHEFRLEDLSKAFDLLKKGECLRTVLKIADESDLVKS